VHSQRSGDPAARRPAWVHPADFAIPLGTFALAAALAELLGAKNLGTALGVGQVAFVAAVVFVILRAD
jgi:hypothetical protein